MLDKIMMYYGAVCGVLSAIAFALHVFGLDETKFGKIFVKGANDVAGMYKAFAARKAS